MGDQRRGLIYGALVADSLALGVHWIYDTAVIKATVGRITNFEAPGPDAFHGGKTAGEFTHYGDQAMVLLESLADAGDFDLTAFAGRWRSLFDDYTGYRDHATKETLIQMANGRGPTDSGSESTDLGGASRMAPLGYLLGGDAERFAEAARAQTAMTHTAPAVLDAAGFFARVMAAVLAGESPRTAMTRVAQAGFAPAPLSDWLEQGLASVGKDTNDVIGQFGRMCAVPAAFPAVVHLVASYETDLETALIENTMAGGDSAARGMVVGAILGAAAGGDGIPVRWREALVAGRRVEAALHRIDPAIGS